MTDSPRSKTEALRDELFGELEATEIYKATLALDDAVFAMGGQRRLPRKGSVVINVRERPRAVIQGPSASATGPAGKLSQPDAAKAALLEAGKPMTVRELIPVVTQKGIAFTANDPIASLGSQLSRNPDMFESRRMEGQYYWWLKGQAWPDGISPDLPLEEE